MDRAQVAYHLKGRWQYVREREIAELRETPLEVRFVQTAALMRFAKLWQTANACGSLYEMLGTVCTKKSFGWNHAQTI